MSTKIKGPRISNTIKAPKGFVPARNRALQLPYGFTSEDHHKAFMDDCADYQQYIESQD